MVRQLQRQPHGARSAAEAALAVYLVTFFCFELGSAAGAAAGADTASGSSGGSDVDADCDSPYWFRVRAALSGRGPRSFRLGSDGGPTNFTLARLAAEEHESETASRGDSAGCKVGRFLLSVWRLVRSGAEERAWNLQQSFGKGFYVLPWRPQPDWPIFRALTRLRAVALRDAAGTYVARRCERLEANSASAIAAEDELMQALQVGGPIALLSGATAGSRFLLHASPSAACPLAIAAAYWALAGSLLATAGFVAPSAGSGGDKERAVEVEVGRLIRLGEEAAKSWQMQRLPFLDLLVSAWPLWDIASRIEEHYLTPPVQSRRASGRTLKTAPVSAAPAPPQRAQGASVVDPREPVCPRGPGREAMARGLERQRVEVIVVYGRCDRVKILHRYLLRNLRINGGVVDRVHFVVFAAMQEDLEYLQQLVADHGPVYNIPQVTGRRLAKIYSVCEDPDTVYIKIDDDVVFLADEAFPNMVRERLRGRCGLVSANVVNHAILSAVHQDVGAIRNFFMPPDEWVAAEENVGSKDWRKPRWLHSDEGLAMGVIMKQAQSQCVWAMWECGAWMHESFLSRLADGTDCAYDFGWHDFHAHGHGNFLGDRFVPLPYTRWSINVIAFKKEDLAEARAADLAEDDEAELSVMVHHRMGKRACAVGHALAVHFSYSRQDDGIMENTDLLARYDALSLELAAAPEVTPRR